LEKCEEGKGRRGKGWREGDGGGGGKKLHSWLGVSLAKEISFNG
jgi:hypothetical protein